MANRHVNAFLRHSHGAWLPGLEVLSVAPAFALTLGVAVRFLHRSALNVVALCAKSKALAVRKRIPGYWSRHTRGSHRWFSAVTRGLVPMLEFNLGGGTVRRPRTTPRCMHAVASRSVVFLPERLLTRSGIVMTSSVSRRDSSVQPAAESLRGADRAERLGNALARMARELADARRQIAILKRENAALRAQLDGGRRRETAARNGAGRPW